MEKYDLIMDNTFTIIQEEDYPVIQREGRSKIGRFVPRKINHPHFKNSGLGIAIKFLKNRKNGTFVFRPSSKGTQYLNLTWKFYSNIFVHCSIKEGFKTQNENISKELYLHN